MNYKNEFSWSVSRRNIFEKCKRKYYLAYYRYWGGWETGADEFTREIYILKQLKNKYLWIGSIVHDAIKTLLENLKQGVVLPEDILIINVKKRVKNDWMDSKLRKYRLTPKKYCGLFEDEYYSGISENELENILHKIETLFNNFYTSKYFEMIKNLNPNQWLSIEEMASFRINNTSVNMKLDFACRFSPEIVMIVDWKTGTIENIDEFQLTCYSLYGAKKWNISPTDITAVYFSLPNKRERVISINEGTIKITKSIIQKSIIDMKNMLDNKENNIASIEKFPPVSNKESCKYCNYKKICLTIDGVE